MRYIDVEWRHQDPNEPIRLVSELASDRLEVRKLEFYRDGRVRYAPREGGGATALGEYPVPSLAEINSDPQFLGREISADQFEGLWARCTDLS